MPKASRLEAAIKNKAPGADVELIRGGGGDFIVIVDGDELWNKRARSDDAFPNFDGLAAEIAAR